MPDRIVKQADEVSLIVFACEAGMGSSLMGTNQLKKLVKKANLDIAVQHSPVGQLPPGVDVIVVHRSLSHQAHVAVPDAVVVPFTMFFNDPAVKQLVATLKAGEPVISAL